MLKLDSLSLGQGNSEETIVGQALQAFTECGTCLLKVIGVVVLSVPRVKDTIVQDILFLLSAKSNPIAVFCRQVRVGAFAHNLLQGTIVMVLFNVKVRRHELVVDGEI